MDPAVQSGVPLSGMLAAAISAPGFLLALGWVAQLKRVKSRQPSAQTPEDRSG